MWFIWVSSLQLSVPGQIARGRSESLACCPHYNWNFKVGMWPNFSFCSVRYACKRYFVTLRLGIASAGECYISADVLFCCQDEREVSKFRALLNHLVFGSPLTGERLLQVDHSQPIFVWAGVVTGDA